jgi:acetyltransferase-like isoleucine patch superfamily enzyme
VTIESGVFIYVSGDGILKIGDHSFIGSSAYLHSSNAKLIIGENCFIGRGTTIVAQESILIGADGLIGEYVTIRDQNHIIADKQRPYNQQGNSHRPIAIHNNVWLGAKSTILQGVTIETGAVVGANSVVNRSVPAGAIVAGTPARPIGGSDLGGAHPSL